jgi:hypothetical protein
MGSAPTPSAPLGDGGNARALGDSGHVMGPLCVNEGGDGLGLGEIETRMKHCYIFPLGCHIFVAHLPPCWYLHYRR